MTETKLNPYHGVGGAYVADPKTGAVTPAQPAEKPPAPSPPPTDTTPKKPGTKE